MWSPLETTLLVLLLLVQVDWLRVVLDEAHTIKNAATQTAKAAQAIKAERRWAVTGTPISNSLQVRL